VITGAKGNAEEAADLLSQVLRINPNDAYARYNHGVALGELGRLAEATESYDRAIALRPDYVDAWFNRGVAQARQGRPAEALASYERAVALKPDYVEAHNNRGIALAALGRHDEALASYERAVALKPDYAIGYNNRGNALRDLNRLAEAVESYGRALAIKADYVEACNNLGVALIDLERPAEALAWCERALALRPDYAEACYHAGNALRDLHRYSEAAERFERAVALRPDYAAAHWNLADCRLLLGDFARGWQEYEWRWKLADREALRRDFRAPVWLGGQPVRGLTILLHSEMGLGDTLLFCRYAKRVAALGASVLLEVQPALLPLLANLEGATAVLARGASLPHFDCHCPLMSLPLAFRTDLRTIPADVPYVRSDPVRVAAWKDRIGETAKPRIGLVWSGSAALRNDRRSMALADALPLVGEWAEWVSLQKEVRESDAALLAAHPEIRHFGPALSDFADTAALVESTDLVVTIDSSVANLAGAMGKSVWILLPHNPHDWRWLLDREDSPWYPTARLFRQSSPGDWRGVVQRVGEELARRFRA
jgi:tetratricopeptide (TPR) repeat protein